MTDEQLDEKMGQFAQQVSYDFGDLMGTYPYPLRSVAMAVVSNCIAAQIANMPKVYRQAYERMRSRSEVITLPPEFDPRNS